MSLLYVRLLGEFLIMADGEPVPGLHQPRLQSLLAYLLLHRDAPQSRQHLAFLFWPDSTEKQARTNLRKALHHIRHHIPQVDRFVHSDAHAVQWMPHGSFTLDVADFEEGVAQANAAWQQEQPAEAIAHLAEAVELYRGELLPDCYDDWLWNERERLHQCATEALTQLMAWHEEAQEYAAAIHAGRRLLTLDPLHETTYRHLMRLHALHGDRTGALRLYETCATLLQRELGVPPSEETQELYERLQQAHAPLAQTAHPRSQTDRTRSVGRREEWRQMQAAWRVASETGPHFALVAGEAGIGKSHLAEQMQQWAAQQGFTTAYARAYAAEGGLAYAPVIDWLRSSPFARVLPQLDAVWRSEVARLLPELLAQDPDLARPEPLTERWQRQRLFEGLVRAILLAKAPLLLVLDDLQWCDEETLEWLHFLLRAAPDLAEQTPAKARLLVVGTVRSEEVNADHPLTALRLDLRRTGRITEIELGPLNASETAGLAAQVSAQALDDTAASWIYRASEGNPLFVVEMVQAGNWAADTEAALDVGDFSPPARNGASLPPKVHAVIQSRLAQLSATTRELTSLAATLGRSFTFEVLVAASGWEEEEVLQGLDELWQRRIVREQGANTYDFSHDRIREVAYAEAGPMRRKLLHKRAAQALQRLYSDRIDAVSGQLGLHFERSLQWEEALGYYQRAAHAAAALYAFESALFYLNKMLQLLSEFSSTTAHTEQQIKVLLEKADILIITKGWTAVERKQVVEQMYTLAQSTDNKTLLFQALHRVRAYCVNTGQHARAYKVTEEALAIAESLQDAESLCDAYDIMGSSLLQLGNYSSSLVYFEKAQKVAEGAGKEIFYRMARSRMMESLWACGYPEQAQGMALTNLEIIDQQQDPFKQVHIRESISYLYQRSRMPVAAQEIVNEIADLCGRFGFDNYALSAKLIGGWAQVEMGSIEDGTRQIQQALESLEEIGDQYNRPYFLAILAEAQLQDHRPAAAQSTLVQAQEWMERSGDRLWASAIYRLLGDCWLHLEQSGPQAAHYYQLALDTAREQGAKSLELCAATSLARLWQSQGQYAEAHELLFPIYDWFSEGFDMPDLRSAQALLRQLGPNISR